MPPTGPLSEAAHAAGEAAKVARASPRFAIAALACVAALGLGLGFVYLLVTRPDAMASPLPTVGDWMTRSQFRDELDARDKRLSPATNEAIGVLREELKAMRSEAARDRAEMRAEIATQGVRIDRILEIVSKPR